MSVFTGDHTRQTLLVVFVSFALFWLFRVAAAFFDFRNNRTPSRFPDIESRGQQRSVVPLLDGRLEQAASALRDTFISLAIVTLAAAILQELDHTFLIISIVVSVVGYLWALALATKCRFSNGMLIFIVPLFVTLWALLI